MTDFEDRLRDRMRAEVSGVQPEERLAAIRRRTEQGTRSTWWVPMASGLAALGLVAAAARARSAGSLLTSTDTWS